jgi:16S rRNA processing protein RimM
MTNAGNEGQTSDRFSIGAVVAMHGIQGAIKIRTQITNPSLLENLENIEFETKNHECTRATVDSLRFDKGHLVITVQEYPDRTSAEPLIGCTVYASRAQLGNLEEDEFWVRDLVGLDVYTVEGKHIGTVCDIIAGANQLIEIQKLNGTKDDTVLVPFVKALVPTVDMVGRRIEVVDMPGLLD